MPGAAEATGAGAVELATVYDAGQTIALDAPPSVIRRSVKDDPVRPFLATMDAVSLGVAGLVAGGTTISAVLVAVVLLAGLVVGGEHRNRMCFDALADLPRLLRTLSLSLLVLAVLAALWQEAQPTMRLALASLAAVVFGRSLAYAHIRAQRRKGRFTRTTVIVGGGNIGRRLFDVFTEHPEYGVAPVAVIDDVPGDQSPLELLTNVWESIGLHGANHMVFAFGPTPEGVLVTSLRSIVAGGLDVHVVPRFFEIGIAPPSPVVESVRGISLIPVRQAAIRAHSYRTKRLFDVVIGGTALVALAPVLAALAVLVRLDSPGPILFRQLRIGQGGRAFHLLKFRSMLVNDDSDTTWNVGSDQRLTRIGAVFRKLSLDELPQLYNVFRGDMSLVGPRPERPHFVERFRPVVDGYDDRHRLPAGLTGLAQINGLRGDTSIPERARFDNYYVENWSLWLDIVILFRTVGAVVRHALSSER